MPEFVHLHLHSQYSFLDGASDLADLVQAAAECGMPAIALTDHDNVAAAVRLQSLCQKHGIAPIQGAELTLAGGHHLVLLARNAGGYANLCRLLTASHLGNIRGQPALPRAELQKHSAGLIALSGCRRGEIPGLILHGRYADAEAAALFYRDTFEPGSFYLELEGTPLPGTQRLNHDLCQLADRLALPVAATANVHYLRRDDFPIHDLLVCTRTLTRLSDVNPERRLNAENYLRTAEEMAAMFADRPDAIANTVVIAAQCEPALTLGARLHPQYRDPSGEPAGVALRRLVYAGAERRYGRVTPAVAARLDHELDIISQLGYEDYFLLVWDVARYSREQGIRYAGRGSAADSAVAYCLYITEVDAIARGLLFERFMSLERAEKPDIDIDFDARHRDKVAEYVYQKYGQRKVAAVCTYNTFHGRSALRDFGKAMDFPPEEIDRIAKRLPYYFARDLRRALAEVPELRDSDIPVWKYERLIEACERVTGFPRFFGTHLGGLVISRDDLTDVTPLQMSAKGVVISQFDKEFVEDLGLIKLDLLSLRTLSAVDVAVNSIRERRPEFDYERISLDDPATYRLLNSGQTVGIFQLESPAQRALQARLGARSFEDIVASVAIIRPGPIKGNMVEPFIQRRAGREPVTYLHPKLEPILAKTYGVVLFQEQVIEIATAVAGFTPGEADRLRRVMTHSRSQRDMDEIGRFFIGKAVEQGVEQALAETIFSYIVGYASYGFCEAHAAAFASTAFKTAYLVRHYPAEFFAAILSQQPMGYYPEHVICSEAIRRGVAILPLDINRSGREFRVEDVPPGSVVTPAGARRGIRIALRQLKGMSEAALNEILAARENGPFVSFADFCARVSIDCDLAENLILAGAFDALAANRRALIWHSRRLLQEGRSLRGNPLGLRVGEAGADAATGAGDAAATAAMPDFEAREKFVREYDLLGINARGHFMQFFRDRLRSQGFIDSAEARRSETGDTVRVAGLVVRPHRPPTKSGRIIVFFSLEDERGLIDVTVFESIYNRYGKLIFADPCPPLKVLGKIERRGRGVSVIASRIAPLDGSDRV